MTFNAPASVAKLPPVREREKNMDELDVEHLMRVLQAHTVALCALLSTHPNHQLLHTAFETIASRTAADTRTLDVLRKAITPP